MYEALVAVLIGVTLAATTWKCVIYPLFLSPLAAIPAASPIARFSTLWIEWQRLRGNDFQSISAAFATKGSYVLVSPRELALNDIDAVHSVWGTGSADFDKHPSYEYWATQGSLNTFTSVLGSEHRRRHKRIRGVHNRAFIGTSPHIREIMRNLMVSRVLPVLDGIAISSKGATNILPIAQSMTLDCNSAFAFGIPLSLDFIVNASARKEWLDLFATAFPTDQASFWLREHPRLTKYMCMAGIPLVSKDMASARRKFEAWALPKVDAAEEVIKMRDMGQAVDTGQLPVLYDAIRTDLANSQMGAEKSQFTMTEAQRRELASECLDHIAFTAEAFGTVFTYMVYELSHHPKVQRELREELRTIENPLLGVNSPTDIPESQALEHLPLLGAVVKECLRLRNTSPNADPRVTPAHSSSRIGRLDDVPPGTRVCSFGWCLHRNPDVFADPLTWDPHRWLEGGCGDAAAAAKKWFFAFGAGSRNCIGQNLALELMRVSLASVYSRYTTSIVDETSYPGRNRPMSPALTDKLIVKFEKLP
ncbi:Unspecific monooxygenase [Ascochyta lentis]